MPDFLFLFAQGVGGGSCDVRAKGAGLGRGREGEGGWGGGGRNPDMRVALEELMLADCWEQVSKLGVKDVHELGLLDEQVNIQHYGAEFVVNILH